MSITSKSIFAKLAVMAAIAGLLTLTTVASVSKGTLIKPLPQWFEVLQTGDGEILTIIMTEEAKIELRDLGIIQTRDEFIESLDQWVDLNSGAKILTRQVSAEQASEGNAASALVEVCYRFSSNETYNRETYQLAGGRITGVVQEKISDRCIGF